MKIKSVTLIDFGIAELDSAEKEPSEGSLTGYILRSDYIRFQERTEIIPAVLGVEFGIFYLVELFDQDDPDPVAEFISRIIHPQMVNPETKEATTEITDFKYCYLNKGNFDTYRFEFDWEIVKGEWIFQVLEGRRLLLEKQFLII
jgi:Domain of unknown function (DUF3859)